MIAFVFPGQGSQYVGMGKAFFDNFKDAREVFEEASDVLKIDFRRLVFEEGDEVLRQTVNTQPSILTVSYAIYKSIRDILKKPLYVAGHSLGEYTACVVSSLVDFSQAVYAVRKRGEFMQSAVPTGGAMSAIIGIKDSIVEELCMEATKRTGKVVEVANYNSPEQVVVSGYEEAVYMVEELAKDRGARRVVRLNVSAPFHSSLMREAGERMKEVLRDIEVKDPDYPIISNVTASEVRSGKDEVSLLIEQIYKPVRWTQSIKRMIDNGVNTFIEIGPGKVLSGLIRKIKRDVRVFNVEKVEDIDKLANAFA